MILGEPIILGGGGGIACVVIITTDPSAVVTCSLGNTSISKTANADGKAAFELKKEGVWTVTASLNGETVSYEVHTCLSLETEIDFVSADTVLENNTWETISKVAKKGKASEYWNVGDTKTFLLNGKTYEAQIIGFDHDDVTDPVAYGREKAGITFCIKDVTNDTRKFNSSSTPNNSWKDSELRSTLQYFIDYYFEENLANVIVWVNKKYEPDYSTVETCSDRLFIISADELYGWKAGGANNLLGTQYAYYAAGNSKTKYKVGTTTAIPYWTRSRRGQSNSTFVYIDRDDGYNSNPSTGSMYHAEVFCV